MSAVNPSKILIIFIEPTPYIVDLINLIIKNWPGQVDVLFLSENKSQNWNITLNSNWLVLPERLFSKIWTVIRLHFKEKYALIHLAGWSEPLFRALILFSKLLNVPIAIESDTPWHKTKFWKRIVKRIVYPPLFKLVNLFLP